MKILIVDDNLEKAKAASQVLVDAGVPDLENITHVTNAYDAAKELRASQFDLLILDLMIPRNRLADAELEGGQTLLRDIMSKDTFKRPTHIVGLTSFDEAVEVSRADFNSGLWSILKFDHSSSEWIEQLAAKVRYIVSASQAANDGQTYDYDVAFVCALPKPELSALLALDNNWAPLHGTSDPTQYWTGSIQIDGRSLRAVACHAAQMGMVATAAAVAKVSLAFRPRLVVMTGICAGRENDVQLGDVIVANPTWDYGSGKFQKNEEGVRFAPDPVQVPLDPMLRKHAEALIGKHEFLDGVRRQYTPSKINSVLNVSVGPMATGAAVRSDDGFFEELAEAKRKVIAVDMEAYAVFAAAAEMPAPRPLALVVKSVCDYANSKKDDRYQDYAAHTSAICAVEIVKAYFTHNPNA